MSTYSRESAVKAVRSYYTFLAVKLGALRPHCIIEPSAGGWRNITTASLAPLGKTDEVVELLRYLPYVRGDSEVEWNEKVAPETDAFQYGGAGAMSPNGAASDMWPPGAGEIPAHVAVLTMGGRYGSWLLLDTIEGQPVLHIVPLWFSRRVRRHRHRFHTARTPRAQRACKRQPGLLACLQDSPRERVLQAMGR